MHVAAAVVFSFLFSSLGEALPLRPENGPDILAERPPLAKLLEHAEAKHPKLAPSACFPDIEAAA